MRARRLARSSLSERASGDRLVEVAGRLCGVHAQVQTAAELQLAVRVDGVAQADVRAALWERRALVKAWTLRGTLHLHPAGGAAALARGAARGPRLGRRGAAAWPRSRRRRHPARRSAPTRSSGPGGGLGGAGRSLPPARRARRGGRGARAEPRRGSASLRIRLLPRRLCARGRRRARGSRSRARPVDRRLAEDGRTRALREVCRRFLRTYGPARPATSASGSPRPALKVAEARALFDDLAAELEEVGVDGRPSFVLAGDRSFPPRAPRCGCCPSTTST